MVKADKAQVSWDARKKRWQVRIQVGEEVIKRPAPGRDLGVGAGDDALCGLAVATARNDGYELAPAAVTISRPVTAKAQS